MAYYNGKRISDYLFPNPAKPEESVKILTNNEGTEHGDFVGQIGVYYNPNTDQDEFYIYGTMGWHSF